jgi:hypothetical protein
MKRLYNSDNDKTRLSLTDRLVAGIIGLVGTYNITFANLLNQIKGYTTQLTAIAANQTFTIPANSKLQSIDFKVTAGTPTISAGLTVGGFEIIPEKPISDVDGNETPWIFSASDDIYIGVSGGTVTINITYISNYF